MDQTNQQPRGNFIAFINREKQPGDDRPMFIDGRIAKPGSTEELPFSLWAFSYADKTTGELLTGFSGTIGNVSPDASAADQIEALLAARPDGGAVIEQAGLKLAPNHIAVFVHKPKEGATPKDKTHYGFVNFGDGTPLVQASIWLGKDRYGHAMVSGNTQFQRPSKAEGQEQVDLDQLVEQGVVSKGMPKKSAGRSGR